jgi:hypothetical protein
MLYAQDIRPAVLGTLLALAGCAPVPSGDLPPVAPDDFPVCHGGTCALVARVSLSPAEWRPVREAMTPAAPDPAAERAQIALAVARLEGLVGPKTGTVGDLGGTFPGLGRSGQMDCMDEATNTTTYLRLLDQAGLLRWHGVEPHATRGFFVLGWPHTTAVVVDRTSGVRFAVDAWFHANGAAPEIVELARWRRGWRPADRASVEWINHSGTETQRPF